MAAAQQQSGGDNAMGPVWIVAGVFFVTYVSWWAAHEYIVSMIFHINLFQAKIAQIFIGNEALNEEIKIMQSVDPGSVNLQQLALLMTSVGIYTRFPVLAILIALAFILYRSDITLKFRRAHNMKSLIAQEQLNWPSIMPVIGKDIVSMDINTGPWAMALTPMEFARKHNLLKKNDALLDKSVPGEEMTATVRRGDAKRVFTLQLGPYWEGFERCPPHARAMAAACMARMNRDRDSAKMILETLDKCSVTGKMNYSIADNVIRKHQNAENVKEIISKHAYLLTVMATLLKRSREDGVFSSSEFLWLKTVDRRLWYMLNCVGRQTPFVEVGGPFAHWRAEEVMGRGFRVPMIDEGIRALEIAVKEVKLSPQELKELKP